MKQGLLIVVSGPSGTGKGTVCGKLLAETPQLAYSISATTRQPREGEVDGQNYYFLTREQFETEIAAGGFLEYADVYGNYYGTPLKKLEERLQAGHPGGVECHEEMSEWNFYLSFASFYARIRETHQRAWF